MPRPAPCLIALIAFDGDTQDWMTVHDDVDDLTLVQWAYDEATSLEIEAGDAGQWEVRFAWTTDLAANRAADSRSDAIPDHDDCDSADAGDAPLVQRAQSITDDLQARLMELEPTADGGA